MTLRGFFCIFVQNCVDMKKIFSIAALLTLPLISFGANPQPVLPEYTFTTIKANPITSVKNQYRSGTCWAFSTIGFIESEVMRLNNITDTLKFPDFSEFFVVSHSYLDRAEKYVRLDGKLQFGAGSVSDDVLTVIRNYGMVPQEAMSGMNYGTDLPVQAELDGVLKSFVETIVRRPNKTLSTAWKRAFKAILDEYLGKWPEIFTVDGKEYTPESYRDALKFNPDDYVTLTSFTHHPFYTAFPLEICDNWRWSSAYNIPIDEMMNILDSAINNGFTVEWSSDVSQWGFTRKTGLAILLSKDAKIESDSDQARWVGTEKQDSVTVGDVIEKDPTQESRQEEFDNKTMTDDHGMQIYGIAKDQNGKKYYMVKNSWGRTAGRDGLWYATEAYVKGQTLEFMLHKDALPKDLRKKLGIN